MKTGSLILLILTLESCHFRSDLTKLSKLNKMPLFRLVKVDSTEYISSYQIPEGRSSILIYFDPDCEHCQRETKSILQNIGQFKTTNLYWITNGDIEETINFSKHFHLDTVPNAVISRDCNFSFYGVFLPPTVPFIAVYDKKKKLSRIYNSETDLQAILNVIKD